MSSRAALAGLALLALAACAPKAPEGVDQKALDDAVGRAIGDPTTCVLIAKAGSTKPVYRYNEQVICSRAWPSCEPRGGARTVDDLLAKVTADKQPVMASCFTNPDGSRGVGWAAGPIPGKDLVYAAVMEGDRALPGRVMATRLGLAFQKVGLTTAPAP